ncbi:MAG: hypothetical protein PHY92_02075 [Alphaproteobacteria bacterium]|nr:hypothetical protein [Alphaproteobacteria bacterium]
MSAAATRELTDEQMVQLVRNALIVAGSEMGTKGDHWPVIKSTIRSIMKDWEDLQIERAVYEEMKKHLYKQLEAMERVLPECAPDVQKRVGPKLKELRDVYDAFFTDINECMIYIDRSNLPMHVLRAEVILDTLEGGDA